MVKQNQKPVIEEIELNYVFDKESIKKLYGYFQTLSDKVTIESNGYEFESISDFDENIGLFDFNNWEIDNFRGSFQMASNLQYDGKKLSIYNSDINSIEQQNLKGKIKTLVAKKITSNTSPNVTQHIIETEIKGSPKEGKLTFWQKNSSDVRTALYSVISTIVAGLILFFLFNIG